MLQVRGVAPGTTQLRPASSFRVATPPLPQHANGGTLFPATLTRSLRNRKIAGVCGGIAPVFRCRSDNRTRPVRALFFCPSCAGIIPYIVLLGRDAARASAAPAPMLPYPQPTMAQTSYAQMPR